MKIPGNRGVFNATSGLRLRYKQALKGVEDGVFAWIEDGVSLRMATPAEARAARMAQSGPQKPPELRGAIVSDSSDADGAKRTPSEKILELAMCRAGIEFQTQRPIGPYRADFFIPDSRLVVELDGILHNSPQQIEHDRRRDLYMEQRGYAVLRVTNLEVGTDISGVLRKIKCASDMYRDLTAEAQKQILAMNRYGALRVATAEVQ